MNEIKKFIHIVPLTIARKIGMSRYATGNECNNGNIAERQTSNGNCLCSKCEKRRKSAAKNWEKENQEILKERRKKYYNENKEEINTKNKKYYLENKDKKREQDKRYREENIEKIREYDKERGKERKEWKAEYDKQYRAENKEKIQQYMAGWRIENKEKKARLEGKREARKKNALPIWYGEFDDLVIEEAKEKVIFLENETGIKWHIDHMIPLQAKNACGLHCIFNIQVIPAKLNCSKNNKMKYTKIGEWLKDI